MATERRWKDKAGDWKTETDWHRVVFWRADAVGRYLTKGRAVLVEGRLQTRSYDKFGEKRYVTEVVAENLILIGGGRDAGFAGDENAASSRDVDDADEVPF